MSDHITRWNAIERGNFSEYRKLATTWISDFIIPPGVRYATPEGLRAEDEETRIAFDVQGGVYPIRESVFQASYAPVDEAVAPELDVERVRNIRLLIIDGLATKMSQEFAQGAPFEPFDRIYVVKRITAILDAARVRTQVAAGKGDTE